jgi:acyl carrier protein
MEVFDRIKLIIRDALQLGERVDHFTPSTALLGSIPEFDSMAVVNVLTLIEDEFGIAIADDEIGAETFETVGSLVDFVASKVAA